MYEFYFLIDNIELNVWELLGKLFVNTSSLLCIKRHSKITEFYTRNVNILVIHHTMEMKYIHVYELVNFNLRKSIFDRQLKIH